MDLVDLIKVTSAFDYEFLVGCSWFFMVINLEFF